MKNLLSRILLVAVVACGFSDANEHVYVLKSHENVPAGMDTTLIDTLKVRVFAPEQKVLIHRAGARVLVLPLQPLNTQVSLSFSTCEVFSAKTWFCQWSQSSKSIERLWTESTAQEWYVVSDTLVETRTRKFEVKGSLPANKETPVERLTYKRLSVWERIGAALK